MKKTQKMIHSPRAFKFGLGLIVAASLASMPVLTGASERADDAKAKSKLSSSKSKSSKKNSSSAAKESCKPTAEDLARARVVKLEAEAKKIAARLTPTQKSKLLAILNDGDTEKLTGIDGIGESRSHAIRDARPIKSVEDLQKVRGVGLKTFAGVVDHGKTLTRSRSSSSSSSSKTDSSKTKTKPASSTRSKSSTTKTATKAKA